MRVSLEPADDLRRFGRCENGWESPGPFGTSESLGVLDIDPQHSSVQKQDGAGSLILGRGADIALGGKVREKVDDFVPSHLSRVTHVVESHKSFYPTHVRLFRPATVVAAADLGAHLVQQVWSGHVRGSVGCINAA